MKTKGFVWFLILIVGVMVPVIAQGAVVKAINCGGIEYTERLAFQSQAITYAADLPPAQLAKGGFPYSTIHPIAGTHIEPPYQTERWGTFYYTIDGLTPEAWYLVTLKFAEIYPYAYVGSRIFTVVIDGKKVIMDFDLLLWAGDKYKAFDAKIPVQATGTSMKIEFFGEKCCVNDGKGSVGAKCRTTDAKVNAIVVEDFVFSPSPSAGKEVFAINSGSQVPADILGITYDADKYFVLGQTYSTNESILGKNLGDGTVYQTERYGDFSYAIPTGNGTFTVLLKFAEIYQYIYPGARMIAVDIEGKRVITGLDLDAQFGLYHAYDFFVPFPITVNDGVLNIDFFTEKCCPSNGPIGTNDTSALVQHACEAGQAKVSGILVYTQWGLTPLQ